MVNLMRRHAKIIFAVVTVIVVISFVWWGTPAGRSGAGTRLQSLRLLGGRASAAEVQAARQAIELRSILSGERSGLDDKQLEDQMAIHLLLLRQARPMTSFLEQLIEDIHLLLLRQPRSMHLYVTDEQVGKFAAQLTSSPPQKGEDPGIYLERQKRHYSEVMQLLVTNGISATDFDRILREELMLRQLENLVMRSAKATPAEVRQWWEISHEKMTASIARFIAADYLAKVSISDEEAKKFYENDPSSFAIPEKVKVRYVRFDLQVAKKEISLTEEELRAVYEKNKNFFADEKGQPKPFETVRADLESRVRTEKAVQELSRRAQKMIQEIAPPQRDQKGVSLAAAAAARGLTVAETNFFSLQEPVPGVRVGPNFNQEAFKLREDFRVGNWILGEDGVYVMEFLERQLKNDKPDFAQVKDRVLTAARETRAHELAQKAGQDALEKILAAIRQGDYFAHACAAQGVPAISLPPFAAVDHLSDVPDENVIKLTAIRLNPGETSEWVQTAEGGFILHLDAWQPGDPEQFKKDQSGEQARLLRIKQDQTFQEWVNHSMRSAVSNSP